MVSKRRRRRHVNRETERETGRTKRDHAEIAGGTTIEDGEYRGQVVRCGWGRERIL